MKSKNFLISLISGIFGGFLVVFISLFFFKSYIVDFVFNTSKFDAGKSQIYERYPNTPIRSVNYFGNEVSNTLDFTNAAEIGMSAVVHIKTQYNQPNYTLYDFILGTTPRYSTPVLSSGSGVIISPDGYIVTNNHVIENAEIIEIVLNNKKSYTGKLVGRDVATDIALLKIEATGLNYLQYGNSDGIKIGEWVLAIGNPFNLTSTVTAGIVSAKARNIDILSENLAIESFIQTDAAVNPGNSGGALVNTQGELIGINTAIASRTGSFVGYSFAVPVNIVRKIVADLVEFGEVQRAYIGGDIVDLDAQVAKRMNINDIEGVYIARVWSDGALDKAGVKGGDIITDINSVKINSCSELLEQISKYRPGEVIYIKAKRNNISKEYKVVLQNKYGNQKLVKSEKIESLGAKFEPISNYDKNRLRINSGIQVTDLVAGKFAANGVQKGFILVKVNNEFVNSTEDLKNIIQKSDGTLFIEGVYPNGATAYYAFKIN